MEADAARRTVSHRDPKASNGAAIGPNHATRKTSGSRKDKLYSGTVRRNIVQDRLTTRRAFGRDGIDARRVEAIETELTGFVREPARAPDAAGKLLCHRKRIAVTDSNCTDPNVPERGVRTAQDTSSDFSRVAAVCDADASAF